MILTPITTISALLEGHPDLQEAIVSRFPLLSFVNNPVLREKLARVVTLDQAATMAGVALPDLLAYLRKELGEDAAAKPEPQGGEEKGLPTWYDPAKVVLSVDVTALLASGEHPLARVKKAVAQGLSGAIVELRSSFEPTPLITLFREEGLDVWCALAGGQFHTCILKP